MNVNKSCRIKTRALEKVRDLVSRAITFKMKSEDITQEFIKIINELPKETPYKITIYLNGYLDRAREEIKNHHLEFCHIMPNGDRYSTHKDSKLYYKSNGITVVQLNDATKNGFFWKDSDKEYFVGDR